MTATTTTTAFQMFALDYNRLERDQKEIVINELIAYSKAYSDLLNGNGSALSDFDGAIMSQSFDRYISELYIDELGEVIKHFLINF